MEPPTSGSGWENWEVQQKKNGTIEGKLIGSGMELFREMISHMDVSIEFVWKCVDFLNGSAMEDEFCGFVGNLWRFE